jgi:2-methylcitrate dehydratase PrpD
LAQQSRSAPAVGGPVSGPLVEFVLGSTLGDVPEKVRHEAKRSILNFFGAALGGNRDGCIERMLSVLGRFSVRPEASIIGRSERLDVLGAAFVNAASGNVFDFDDTHSGTIIHPTAPVAPALFAMAEVRPITGSKLLQAFLVGVEVECRIGKSVSPGHYRRGWHITSTCGIFGSAAAVARILRLDAERTLWALGNASAQSAGLVETLGTMAKSISVGNSARGGILAALLAETGLTGPAEPLAGPRGFCSVLGDAPHFEAITGGLGERWEILANTHKPYPCGVVLNPVIDACFALRSDPLFSLASVKGVRVEGHPLLRERADRPSVRTGREAQVSAQHSVAVVLIHGAAGVAQYDDDAVNDPAVLALRDKVQVVEAPGIAVEAARVTVSLHEDATLARFVENGRGTPERPLTDAEIETKVRDLAGYGCRLLDPARLIDAVWELEKVENAGSVMALARG